MLSSYKRSCNGMVGMRYGRVRWEVVGTGLVWSVVGVESRVRRGFRCPARGYVNEQSIVYTLAFRVVGVNDFDYGLVGLQGPARLLFPVTYAQSQVRGVVLAAQGVGVFPENLLANVINEIIFIYGN